MPLAGVQSLFLFLVSMHMQRSTPGHARGLEEGKEEAFHAGPEIFEVAGREFDPNGQVRGPT
jgi:hypothetical protein